MFDVIAACSVWCMRRKRKSQKRGKENTSVQQNCARMRRGTFREFWAIVILLWSIGQRLKILRSSTTWFYPK